eukprot:TRINITY_DN34614_c0_g1_i1.p1 TRINITY_DN34614_c0_g1~~TRINITY_DN34614_c0_g1_i1.p1  ORF type:complete len:323 (+),score=56.23 TRINITY_DN34614_c0_g1_i1:54-1022(+)
MLPAECKLLVVLVIVAAASRVAQDVSVGSLQTGPGMSRVGQTPDLDDMNPDFEDMPDELSRHHMGRKPDLDDMVPDLNDMDPLGRHRIGPMHHFDDMDLLGRHRIGRMHPFDAMNPLGRFGIGPRPHHMFPPNFAASTKTRGPSLSLVKFLDGTGTDNKGNHLKDMWEYSDRDFNLNPGSIEWMLPTDRPPRENGEEVKFTEADQAKVKANDKGMKDNIRKSAERYLAFLGLKMSPKGTSPVTVARGENFKDRLPIVWEVHDDWFGGVNRHWLSVTRLLRCLKLAGLEEEANAVLTILEDLVQNEADEADHSLERYWRRALQ